jgi:hypothetical protein
LVVLLLAACGDSADDAADTTLAPTTTAPPTTTTTVETTTTTSPVTPAEETDDDPETLTVLRFDGSSCEISGDLRLRAGLNEFVVIDTSGELGDFDLLNLPDGYTIEDALEVWNETHQTADFVKSVIHIHFGDGERRILLNMTTGTWSAACITSLPAGTWLASERIIVE